MVSFFSITFKTLNVIWKFMNYCAIKNFLEFALSLRVNKVEISSPKPIVEGSTVCLKCLYKLNHRERFDGIEWFKDGESILQLTPGNDNQYNDRSVPFKLALTIDGVDVDVSSTYLCKKLYFILCKYF